MTGKLIYVLPRDIEGQEKKRACARHEHWTGLELDWIRARTNFVNFGLDQGCKMLYKFRIRAGIGLSLWKRIV